MKKINKLDVVLEKVNAIQTTVAVQTEVLAEHQRRSLAAENYLGVLEKRTEALERRFLKVDGALRLVGYVVACITFVDMCLKIFEHVMILKH